MVMASERYEIRLDTEHKRRLRELSAAYGVPGSTLLKDMIDRLYKEKDIQERLAAVERISRLNGEDVPDMATLKKQLGRSNDVL
jgi:predicted DNA-binding protein